MNGHVATSTSALPKRRGTRLAAAATTVGMLAAAPVMAPALTTPRVVHTNPQLTATVYTVDGFLAGLVGGLTNTMLQGSVCAAPNTCTSVRYPAFPGAFFVDQGGAALNDRIANTTGEIVGFGHSEGAEVVYKAIRDYAADPSTAPDPATTSFIVLANPERKYGGVPWIGFTNPQHGIPADTPYQVTDIARQYDGWADFPTNPFNLIAVANAIAGALTLHNNYADVDPDDPANSRFTEGNVTYILVPTKLLPLISWTGPFAQALDNLLRPMVEAGYNRPVPVSSSATVEDDTAAITAAASADSGDDADAPASTGVVTALRAAKTTSETTDSDVADTTDKTTTALSDNSTGDATDADDTATGSGSETTDSDEKASDTTDADTQDSDAKDSDTEDSDTKESDTKDSDVKDSDTKTSETKDTDSKDSTTKDTKDSNDSKDSGAKKDAGSADE